VRKAFNGHRLFGQSCVPPCASQPDQRKINLWANFGKRQDAVSHATFALIHPGSSTIAQRIVHHPPPAGYEIVAYAASCKRFSAAWSFSRSPA
jgi:hypothetical protein